MITAVVRTVFSNKISLNKIIKKYKIVELRLYVKTFGMLHDHFSIWQILIYHEFSCFKLLMIVS